MVQKTKKIWMDGKFVDWDNANVHVLTLTLHYGFGLFEGIRCYKCSEKKSAIFRLPDHIERLYDGLKILSMEFPFTKEQVIDACIQTVKENDLRECYIRPLVFSGEGAMGLSAKNPTRIAIAAWPWGAYLGDEGVKNGIRTKISSFDRHHVNVGMVRGKIIGQYVTSMLARHEATNVGCEEAIMLDTSGYVAEASACNIFAIKDGRLFTPPTSSPILAGFTRKSVLEIAADFKYKTIKEKFTRDFLYLCDEVFLTGTAAEITPVREIDDRPIGDGKVGEITKRLQQAFFDAARGKIRKYRKWLTMINW